MRTITIRTYPSMPHRYKIIGEMPGLSRVNSRDANDPGEAAAIAIEYARSFGGQYVIIGPEIVMNFIPPQLRSSDKC